MGLSMTSANTAGLDLAFAAILSLFVMGELSAPAEAARPSYNQLLAACKAKFGMEVTSVSVKKNGQIVCQQGPGPGATRKEIFEYCRKSLGATTLTVRKKANGKWECRYYGRY